MNILFLNVGRRCELVESFRQALRKRGGGIIYGSDVSPLAPGLQVVDHAVIFPPGDSQEFKSHIIKFCLEYEINLVIPTIDPDLIRLDRLQEEFQKKLPSCKLLLSSRYCIEHARNKNLSKKLMKQLGVYVPQTISLESKDWSYPIFVRPVDGSSGIGAKIINCHQELQMAMEQYNNLLIEEFIEGEEYTVDVFCDFEGNALLAIPRRRIKVRAGEVVQGVIERHEEIESLAKYIAEGFQARGPVTVQFRYSKDNKIVAIEINARMGGGLPLAIAAGADWPGWILDLCKGIRPDVSVPIIDQLYMTRCDRSFYISIDNIERNISNDCKSSEIPTAAYEEIQAWIFDLDDTLYPERDFVFNGYRAVAEKILTDYHIVIEQDLQELFLHGARGDLFTVVLKKYDIKTSEKYIQTLVDTYRSNTGILRPYIDVVPLLKKLKEKSKAIGLVSDGWYRVQKAKFDRLSLQSYFNAVIFTDALGGTKAWKPSACGYEQCLAQLGIDSSKAIYIGDNEEKDFIGAKKLGMRTLKISRPGSIHNSCFYPDEFKADYEMDSLSKILQKITMIFK